MSHQQDQHWFKPVSQSAKKLKGVISDASSQVGEFVENTTSQVKQSTTGMTSQISQVASHASSQAGELLGNTTSQVKQTASGIANQISQTVSNQVQSLQPSESYGSFDLSQVDEATRLSFYGALFAIATADGQLDKDEMELVFGIMDLENMSEPAKRQVQSFVVNPPPLLECLRALSHTEEPLRFCLMVNLVDTVWANDELDPREETAILLAQTELQVTDEQLAAIKGFIQKIREVRIRGLDDHQAADAVKAAVAGLGAVGIPIAAVYLSGSVMGLSAAGITSGLAALGLGFGMVPGIGVAVLVGTGIFWGVSQILDLGGSQAKEKARQLQERKVQLVIRNMQTAIGHLHDEISTLQEKATYLEASANSALANQEAIRILTERLRFMKQSITKKQQAFGILKDDI